MAWRRIFPGKGRRGNTQICTNPREWLADSHRLCKRQRSRRSQGSRKAWKRSQKQKRKRRSKRQRGRPSERRPRPQGRLREQRQKVLGARQNCSKRKGRILRQRPTKLKI